ncbi:hypothetical protein RJ641_021642, partial [Dillenia turbinata]
DSPMHLLCLVGYDIRSNPEFDQAQIQILGRTKFPSLDETISLVYLRKKAPPLGLKQAQTTNPSLVNENGKRNSKLLGPSNIDHGGM